MSDPALLAVFALGAAVSLAASWRLVISLERVGARLGLSEALLGMLAALAADAPEITAAVTALTGHEDRIGAGVVIGSNVFNLAALIGLAALVAGRIALHRRVVVLGGAVALWIAAVTVLLATGAIGQPAALVLAAGVFVPYVAALGLGPNRLRGLLPPNWAAWMIGAIGEEEQELRGAIHPDRGRGRDWLVVVAAVLVVVGASVAMERSAAKLGDHWGIAPIVVGAIVLAAVTSLPNAVAGIYLATQERGPAALSTSLNSNAINVLAGLLIPTLFVGVAAPSGETTYIACAYLAMTLLCLGFAYAGHGLRRLEGAVIVCSYVLFAVVLVAVSG